MRKTILISSRSRVSTDEETNDEKWKEKGWKMPAVRLLPRTFAKSRAWYVYETHCSMDRPNAIPHFTPKKGTMTANVSSAK